MEIRLSFLAPIRDDGRPSVHRFHDLFKPFLFVFDLLGGLSGLSFGEAPFLLALFLLFKLLLFGRSPQSSDNVIVLMYDKHGHILE